MDLRTVTYQGISGTAPLPPTGDLGVVTLSLVSWPAGSPYSLCLALGEVGVGLGPEGGPSSKVVHAKG